MSLEINRPFIEMSRVIQGEGLLMGQPAILLRTWGCPYRCKFGESECDTKYAWAKPEISYSVDDAISYLSAFGNIRRVILTGGEPTLWKGKDMMRLMHEATTTHHKSILVETAGYDIPSEWSKYVDVWSISPKIGYVPNKDINWRAIGSMLSYNDKSYIKLVVPMTFSNLDTDSFHVEVCALISQFWYNLSMNINAKQEDKLSQININNSRLWLMPEGVDYAGLSKLRPKLVDFCSLMGINYSDRLHIVAFGEEIRGK